jgi:hypothetical protein
MTKIRLTESQYKRLLSEDNKSFLDGQVNFSNIGNNVDGFVAKCFEYIFKLRRNTNTYDANMWRIYVGDFKKEFSLSTPESTLLAYNYINFNDGTGDFKKFIGQPLEYFGKFSWSGNIPVSAYVSGDIYGDYKGYATSAEEFYNQISDGDYDDYDPSWDDIDYDCHDLNWEIDSDYASDRLEDHVNGFSHDEVMDRIEIDN